VNASGDLQDLVSLVYLNTIKIPVPAAIAGGLTLKDVDDIRAHGPYTRLFCTMKPLLEPSKVEADMDKWFLQTMRYVKQACNLERASYHESHSLLPVVPVRDGSRVPCIVRIFSQRGAPPHPFGRGAAAHPFSKKEIRSARAQ
jgi:hypothetical protein